MKKLFVGNLPFSSSEAELRAQFEPFGDLRAVDMPTIRGSGRPRGFAFVTFEEEGAAMKAMEATNGIDFGGRELRVAEAVAKDPSPSNVASS